MKNIVKNSLLGGFLLFSVLVFAQIKSPTLNSFAEKIGKCWFGAETVKCLSNWIKPEKKNQNRVIRRIHESISDMFIQGYKLSDFQVVEILVFEDFYFKESKPYEPYQIYFFMQDQSGKKYIAEGDIWLKKNKALSASLDFIHPAESLQQYINTHAEADMIESHPPSVTEYLNGKNG